MTATRRTRPLLATVISLWEVFIVAMAIAGRIVLHLLRHPRYGAESAVHASPLHIPGLLLGYALALAGAAALWQMRRSAFGLLAARAFVSLVVPFLSSSPHNDTFESYVPLFYILIDIFAFALNAAIAWYAFYATKPKRRRRRRRSHRKHRASPSQSTREAKPEPTSATQDAPLTTSRFYLSPDHEKTIRKD